MQYLLLIYRNETEFAAMTGCSAMRAEYMEFTKGIVQAGNSRPATD